ncbi:MAG: J domain-containing protein [Richelia sp. SM1_7_0]|nr:J domain-containing protein [Richelia sp. SM1_7_0]
MFLFQFEQHLITQRKRGYKIGWIWHSLLSSFDLTAVEICWLSVIFDYSPYWAYYKINSIDILISKDEVFSIIDSNRSDWLRYFQSRWGGWNEEQTNTSNKSTHKSSPHQYYYHLEVLQLSFPFTKEELKSAYRKKSLTTHPDTGGTAEAFRKVHNAYQVLLSI